MKKIVFFCDYCKKEIEKHQDYCEIYLRNQSQSWSQSCTYKDPTLLCKQCTSMLYFKAAEKQSLKDYIQ